VKEQGPAGKPEVIEIPERLRQQAGEFLQEAARVLQTTADAEPEQVARVAALLAERMRKGYTLYTCGNGGSAADAQHVAAELSGRFYLDRPALPAISLNTNVSAITAISNDYSFDDVFVRQLAGCAAPGDILMVFTTSGRSPNIRRAVEWARDNGLTTIGMTGENGRGWSKSCDFGFVIPSTDTPHIQQGHITLGHAICALAEAELYGPHGTPPGPRGRVAGGSSQQ
jgi:D-sedoheptulose 7-phosphate isomerase